MDELKRIEKLIEYAKEKYKNITSIQMHYNITQKSICIHMIILFDNNYGVSIINDGYRTKEKPFEMALLYKNELTHDAEDFQDVVECIDENDCIKLIDKVAQKKE